MKIRDILYENIRDGARSFGIWLDRLNWERNGTDRATYDKLSNSIHLSDYDDDDKNNALRYRLLVDRRYLPFLKSITGDIVQQGWHLTITQKLSSNRWQLVFEPILTGRIPKGIFYHVTPQRNVLTILRDGLIPSESRHGFNFPQNRTYLVRSEKDTDEMKRSLSKRDKVPEDYAVLRVDLNKAPGVRVYIDPELARVAAYTTDAIPATAISLVTEQQKKRIK